MHFFSSASKTGRRITSSESMKHRQGFTSVGTASTNNFVSNDKPEAFSSSEGNLCSSDKLRRLTDVIARTTASVSTARIDALLYPCRTASFRCKKIRVSASSCVHGTKLETSS